MTRVQARIKKGDRKIRPEFSTANGTLPPYWLEQTVVETVAL
jgi:hypothetical protein